MLRRNLLLTGASTTAGLLTGSGARAQKAQDTVRIVDRFALPNIDPYYNSLRTGLVQAHQGWDTLVHRDPETFELKPLLATEWRWVDPKQLEFTLRRGVTFHDGSAFSADDVVYTLNLACNPDSRVATPSNYSWIAGAEKVDDFKVRVTLRQPTPAALEYFALVIPMYPAAYRQRVGPEGYAKAPIGSGPYRITRFEPGAAVEYERFDQYWGGSPKGRPAIRKLNVRFVPDPTTEMTELLSGRADWIWNVNPDQFDNINRLPSVQAVRQESMRVGYLSIDAAGRSGAGNPLTNLKVRQAIWHAIDRETIANRLITGGSRVPPAPCYPSQFGCDGAAAVLYDYNPAKAKALLAEAGFANGFEIEMVSYVTPQWTASVQSYLAAVGIRARVNQMQVAAAVQRAWEGRNPLYMGSWGSYSVNDVSAILPVMFGGGSDDYARDPELQALIARGGSTTDEEERKTAYSAAIRRATENAYWLPLHTYVTIYGHSRQLDFKPYRDELPRFYLAKWK
ncbi:ABC transporter substrate-binding protein [Siccirubricoccus deserti]|uniref:ABC transporter substrate-binding protein n=1 Tax=Siccirubricoccus deserti TaxID=2013562 RepID=A0A9X0R0I1_9PROT|nr:ABC transporter substrate-binding protein [Siccirubricoccus deserti]MBC4016082.1 ABC transporter substrate-binding protein [Siccirubricoccus deserti]GGC46257.1 ABC transporter substrate-binding protein [Siccirubricoccus deserti]